MSPSAIPTSGISLARFNWSHRAPVLRDLRRSRPTQLLLIRTEMIPRFHRRTRASRNERGQTLILVAVSLLSLVGIAALAIDMTTLYVARAEIQHAADAAALAGAKTFVDSGVTTDPSNSALQGIAQTMARDFVTAVVAQNNVAGSPPQLVSGSPLINVIPTSNNVGNPRITVTLQ